MDVLAMSGEVKGQVELPESVFGHKGKPSLLWEAVRVFLAGQRQGTAKTKTRAEVSGTGRKPHRQKHTGRARHGSRRSVIHVGGGVCFGPIPRDYSLGLPKKKRRQALRLVLSARHAEGAVMVLEDFELTEPKTKELIRVLSQVGLAGDKKPGSSVLLLLGSASESLERASSNLSWLTVMPATQVNSHAVLAHEKVVFTEQGLEKFLRISGRAGHPESEISNPEIHRPAQDPGQESSNG